MKYATLTGEIAAGESPSSGGDVEELAEDDFQSILNLRSLNEQGSFSSRNEGVAARTLGLTYLNFPIDEDQELDSSLVSSFRTKVAMLPAPTYVHSVDGPRAYALSLIDTALERGWSADEALQKAQMLGVPALSEKWTCFVRDSIGDQN